MTLSEDLRERGLIKDKTFTDAAWLDKPQIFYLGIDASDDSLTIGNLAVLMLARRLMDGGWKTILLVGGATSLIGDPGGKEEERPLRNREEIVRNVEAVRAQINKLFAGQDFELVDNHDWFKDLGYLEFLREVGKNFSMTELMQRDFITERMNEGGSGISYAEFSYSLIQGYDFWHLHKNHKVVLQIGASDQWGNMLSGVSLIRKKEATEAHAFSMPLVVDKATGRKFGKSEAGAVWLDPAKTSPTQFYQFWINVDDADVENYLKVFTLLSKEEIGQVMSEQHTDPSKRSAQKKLADEATKLVHGSEAVVEAQKHAEVISGSSPESSAQSNLFIKLPSGISTVEALVKSGLVTSNTEARRLIDEGGIYINNDTAIEKTLEASDFDDKKLFLRRGKKFQNTILIQLEE